MNVLNRVTLKTLRRNRTRTLVTILGVILSAAMISAVTTFIASMQNYLYESTVASEGAWEAKIEQIPSNRVGALENDAEIKTLGLVRDAGYAILEGCQNVDKPYLYFMDFSEESFSLLAVNLTEGRMPAGPDEVVLSRHISYNGGVDIQVGQTLTLDIGRRTRSDGEVLWQRNSYETDETFSKEFSRTVTVVGICERPTFEYYSAPGYTVIGYWDPSTMQPGDVVSAYMTVFNPSSIYEIVGRLEEQIGIGYSTSYHSDVLRAMGVSSNDTFNGIIYGLGTILIVLIMVGSIALIYNAFAISVSERSRQFGMLAGAGATSRQIYRSVLFEALVVGGLGIPIGLAAGVAGIGITLHCLQGAIGSLMASTVEASVPFRLVVSVPSLLIAAAVALATVLVSAWFPARRAAKNTAIDAVRQTNDIRLRPRQVRGNRAVRKLFGMEAELALKNFRRNRRRYRATILSLVISLVLFISVATFNEALQQSVGVVYETTTADLVVTSSSTEAERPEELVEAVRELTVVDQAVLYQTYGALADLPASALAREGFQSSVMQRENSDGTHTFNVVLAGMEDRAFTAYTASLGLEAEEYFNLDAPRAIVFDRYREQIWEGSDTSFQSGHSLVHNAGMALNLYFETYEQQTGDRGEAIDVKRTVASLGLTAGYFTDETPFGLDEYQDYSGTIRLLVPLSVAEHFLGGVEEVTGIASITVESDQYHLAEEQIDRLITAMALPYYVNNYAAQMETNRNVLLVINVFSYGFIILISLISIANVFNTISTNLMLRRREFAMLQSVGMTPAGFRRMLCFECLFYGFKALLWGLPLAMLVALWIHAVVSSGVQMGLRLPWAHIGVGVASIFLIVFITMLYAMSKIRKGNIVDQLRNENC